MLIYGILNKVNDKLYIGQTIQQFRKRKNQHKWVLRRDDCNNIHLQRSWNKYGEENFDFFIIENGFGDIDNLNDAEKFWISFLQTYIRSCGYNISQGGINSETKEETKRKIGEANSKEVHMYTEDGEYIKSFLSTVTASKETNAPRSYITSCCNGKGKMSGGYRWCYDKVDKLDSLKYEKVGRPFGSTHTYDKNKKDEIYKSRCKGVIQMDKDENILNEFNSITEAKKYLGVDRAHIGQVCKGKRNTACGFKWKYKLDN